jgi:hypothetical protein
VAGGVVGGRGPSAGVGSRRPGTEQDRNERRRGRVRAPGAEPAGAAGARLAARGRAAAARRAGAARGAAGSCGRPRVRVRECRGVGCWALCPVFFFFLILPSGPWEGTRQRPFCRVPLTALGKIFFIFFDFGPKFFCVAL